MESFSIGDRVRVKAHARMYAGVEGTIVRTLRSDPIGTSWADRKGKPDNGAELKLDDGTTPWMTFQFGILERI